MKCCNLAFNAQCSRIFIVGTCTGRSSENICSTNGGAREEKGKMGLKNRMKHSFITPQKKIWCFSAFLRMVKALGHGLYWNMSSWGGPYSDKAPPRNSSFTYHITTCKAHWLDLQGRTWLLPRTTPLPLFSKDAPAPHTLGPCPRSLLCRMSLALGCALYTLLHIKV